MFVGRVIKICFQLFYTPLSIGHFLIFKENGALRKINKTDGLWICIHYERNHPMKKGDYRVGLVQLCDKGDLAKKEKCLFLRQIEQIWL